MQHAIPELADLSGLTARQCYCESCVVSQPQSHPHVHGKNPTKVKEFVVGQSMHMDNTGPWAWAPGGLRYRLLFTDEVCSFQVTVYVALKSEAPAAWAYAKSVFKALTGNELRFVRTDSDSIFMSQEMKDMYVKAGVIPTYSSPNDHAQNGTAEVAVKYANRGTKTHMTHSGAPLFL